MTNPTPGLATYLADLADPAATDDDRATGGTGSSHRLATVPSAVVWISDGRALVARCDAHGRITTSTVDRRSAPAFAYLNAIVRSIGDRERVMILGPGPARLALEREYVDIHRRPDHLVDVEPVGVLGSRDVVDRLRQLAA